MKWNWLKGIIPDLVIFGTRLRPICRRDPSCPELPDEHSLVGFKTMGVTAVYEPSGGTSQSRVNSCQHRVKGYCELEVRKLDRTLNGNAVGIG